MAYRQVSNSVSFKDKAWPGYFGGVWPRPEGVVYEALERDEEVLLVVHLHWVTKLRKFIASFLLLFIPLVLYVLVQNLAFSFVYLPFLYFISWFWYLGVGLYVLLVFVSWRSDVYLITNERIIDFDTGNLFYRSAREIDLTVLVEANYKAPSELIRLGMKYGDVILSGVQGIELIMHNVPYPDKVALLIGELTEKARQKVGGAQTGLGAKV